MTVIAATLLVALMTLVAAIAGLLVQRRALRESVEQFRLRSDQAPVLIWTARPDTSLDYLNGFCVQLTGRPIEELREKGWLDFVHPEDVDRCLATYMPAFEARTPFLLEYRLRHTNGEYRWFLASGFRSTDPTAATPAMSAATSTSPNGREPKICKHKKLLLTYMAENSTIESKQFFDSLDAWQRCPSE